jgi:hypothetical protein
LIARQNEIIGKRKAISCAIIVSVQPSAQPDKIRKYIAEKYNQEYIWGGAILWMPLSRG